MYLSVINESVSLSGNTLTKSPVEESDPVKKSILGIPLKCI